MKPFKTIILFAFVFFTQSNVAQVIERVEIKGVVSANKTDVFGVTVYNTSSEKGTITNEKGEFTIKVAENDQIELSSILFKDFEVTISKEEIDAKYLHVYLVEMVNNLDEVLLWKYDLTGVLEKDISDVKVFNTNLDVGMSSIDISKYDFSDDYKTAAPNIITRQGQYYNMIDFIEVFKLVGKLFKRKNKKKKEPYYPSITNSKKLSLQDRYTPDFYISNYNIKPDKVQAFISYLESNNFNKTLLLPKNEMKLLEFLTLKSTEFLALK